MKHIFALGTVILSGALLTGACTASDSDAEPDTTENFGGAGGSGGSGGTASTDNTVNTATSSGGSGGSSGGSGGTYSSGGSGGSSGGSGGSSGGTAGGAGMGEGGWAGEEPTTTTGWETTTTGGGGTGGEPGCLGDDDVDDLPDCGDLEYAEVECEEFDPPEPLGVTICNQFAQHATPEAFSALFECLDMIDVEDDCSEDTHDDAVWDCTDNADTGVAVNTCENDLARQKCANLGCGDIDTSVDGLCDVYLSMFSPAGVDHVIACTNENLGDDNGGEWGEGPDCAPVFEDCVAGLLQPTH